jgi:hypothetical protein
MLINPRRDRHSVSIIFLVGRGDVNLATKIEDRDGAGSTSSGVFADAPPITFGPLLFTRASSSPPSFPPR